MECADEKCSTAFHVTCAFAAGARFVVHDDDPSLIVAYCRRHQLSKPKKKVLMTWMVLHAVITRPLSFVIVLFCIVLEASSATVLLLGRLVR